MARDRAVTARVLEFESAEALAAGLAARVAGDLGARLAERGRATLAVPGGTTPELFLKTLGATELDWASVAVTLTVVRWLPPTDPRSNQRLVERTLLADAATRAWFVPLYGGTETPEESLAAVADVLRRDVLPLDVVVAGMGADLHTASLFPGATGLKAALDPDAGPVAVIRTPDAPEPRITLTAATLAGAANRYILIRGTDKRAALVRAEAAPDARTAPVRVLIDGPNPATVYYAP
jgi:6-phosphogluconolactonase